MRARLESTAAVLCGEVSGSVMSGVWCRAAPDLCGDSRWAADRRLVRETRGKGKRGKEQRKGEVRLETGAHACGFSLGTVHSHPAPYVRETTPPGAAKSGIRWDDGYPTNRGRSPLP